MLKDILKGKEPICNLTGKVEIDDNGKTTGKVDMTPEETKVLAPVLALGIVTAGIGFIVKILKK